MKQINESFKYNIKYVQIYCKQISFTIKRNYRINIYIAHLYVRSSIIVQI